MNTIDNGSPRIKCHVSVPAQTTSDFLKSILYLRMSKECKMTSMDMEDLYGSFRECHFSVTKAEDEIRARIFSQEISSF